MTKPEEIKKNLDALYWKDSYKYQNYLASVKNAGYKVMRNSKGDHKVEVDINKAFGEIFGDIWWR